jgi:hypothetical protein
MTRAFVSAQSRLAIALLLAAAAACGGTAGGGGPAAAPTSMATANPVAATPPTGPRPGSGAATLGTAPLTGAMKPVIPSAMAADLQALGLDPKALPKLNKLEPDKLRKLMKTFTRSLGAVCADCHVENDFAAPTPRKNIAAQMWDHFARDMALADGALLYCDSCHQGHITPLLDRHDKKALSAWMDENYVDKLKRKDAKEHSCETCHGDPFEGQFVKTWAATAPPRLKP